MRSRTALFLSIVIVAVLCVAFYQTASIATRGGDDAPIYSTRRYDPYGTAALRSLLAETGHDVRLLENAHLNDTQRGVLVQVLSNESKSNIEAKALLDWVAEGNSVVIFSRKVPDASEKLGLTFSSEGNASPNIWVAEKIERKVTPPNERPVVTVPFVDDRFKDIAAAVLVEPVALKPETDESAWVPLLESDKNVFGWSRRHGSGEILVVGSPALPLNGWLTAGGNLDFLLRVFGDKTIYIDEWSHGFGSGGTIVGLLRDFGLTPMLLQLVFVVGLFAWNGRGQKLAEPPVRHRGRSSVEQIKTLGYLYAQSMSPRKTLQLIDHEVRRRVAEKLRCPVEHVEQRLATLAARDESKNQPPMGDWLKTLKELEKSTLSPKKVEAELSRLLTESNRLLAEDQLERHK